MSDKVQRPIPHGGDYRPHYRKDEADSYMYHLEKENTRLDAFCREFVWGEGESATQVISRLETELRDTKRALEMMCSDFNILEIHASQKFPSKITEYLQGARKERLFNE